MPPAKVAVDGVGAGAGAGAGAGVEAGVEAGTEGRDGDADGGGGVTKDDDAADSDDEDDALVRRLKVLKVNSTRLCALQVSEHACSHL